MFMDIQDYYNFKANGVNDRLSDMEKTKIEELQANITGISNEISIKKDELNNLLQHDKASYITAKDIIYCRTLLALDVDYDAVDRFKIFSDREHKIWFLNADKVLCLVDTATMKSSQVYLKLIIDIKGRKIETHMTLDRFLYFVEIGEFKITSKKFRKAYLKPLSESETAKTLRRAIDGLEAEKTALMSSETYKKYDALYENQKTRVNRDMREIRASESREISADIATQKAKKKFDKKLTDVKTIWNSSVTDAEKAELIGWFARHIKKMKVKVVDKGVSDKVISKAYPDDIYGSKYREKANSSGWDAASGTILVDSVEYAPIDTIKKLSTIKHLQRAKDGGETIFKGKTIHNLDLVLFLLSKYNRYGFKTGEDIKIDVPKLLENEFKNNDIEFIQGFGGF